MIYYDANILMELMLGRPRAQQCFNHVKSSNGDASSSTLSMHILMYFAEKQQLNLKAVASAKDSIVWLPLLESDTQWAFEHFQGKDYEDALQVAIAKREGCKEFVTMDKKLAKKYANHIKIKLIV